MSLKSNTLRAVVSQPAEALEVAVAQQPVTTPTPATTKSALPKLPRTKKAKTPKDCECGCGGQTKGGRFIPGHDAKLHALALRVERGIMKLQDIEDVKVRAAVKKAMVTPAAAKATK